MAIATVNAETAPQRHPAPPKHVAPQQAAPKQAERARHAVLMLILAIYALGMLAGCEPTTRDGKTDRYVRRVLHAFQQGNKAQAQMNSAKTHHERAAAARHFATAAEGIADTVYRVDANGVYPEAIGFGQAVGEWAADEAKSMMKLADQFDRMAKKQKPDAGYLMTAAVLSRVRLHSLSIATSKTERVLRDKYAYENKHVTKLATLLKSKTTTLSSRSK